MVKEKLNSKQARSLSETYSDAAEDIEEVEENVNREKSKIEELGRIAMMDWLDDQPISNHFDIEKTMLLLIICH